MTRRVLIWVAVSTLRQADDEKFSLPKQEEDGLAWAEANGDQVVEVLRVPGHTRSAYTQFNHLAAAARRAGIDAFDRLEQHWELRDFDVVWVRDGDRFARAQGVFGTIVESIIQAGAVIYSAADGYVDRNNYRMWIAMVGYRAASDIDRIKGNVDAGQANRASRGLNPVGSAVLWTHKVIRDENGKGVAFVPDPDKALIMRDVATLVLEGIGWAKLERELFNRFGHGENGRPFPPRKFWNLFYTPVFWGHQARFYRKAGRYAWRKGDWVFDLDVQPPPGVVMFPNVHDPVYAGDLADRLKDELRSRINGRDRGRSRRDTAKRFTGVFICGECGYQMVQMRQEKWHGIYPRLYCYTKHRPEKAEACTQSKGVKIDDAQTFIDARLRQLLDDGDFDTFLGTPPAPPGDADVVRLVESQIATLEDKGRRVIELQLASPSPSLSALYEEQLRAIGQELDKARQRLAVERQQRAGSFVRRQQRQALDDIAAMTLENFWALPDPQINHLLHQLLGKRRFVCLDGEILPTLADARHRGRGA